jgi:hypothetical protein
MRILSISYTKFLIRDTLKLKERGINKVAMNILTKNRILK